MPPLPETERPRSEAARFAGPSPAPHAYAGTPSVIDELRLYRVVYLSPHVDDIAFSLGVTARLIGHGTILNLFTRSRHIDNPALLAGGRSWTVDEVVAQRDNEDARFAALAGLDRQSLALDEPALRGRRHRDLGGLAEDRAQLRATLPAKLDAIAGRGDPPRALFCPAGIGDHVNHLATLLEVADLMPSLSESWRLFFYEDLPYASRLLKRRAGVARLRRIFATESATRHVLRLGARGGEKLALVALYESQHHRKPGFHRFSPRTFGFAAPHEAFWEFKRQ